MDRVPPTPPFVLLHILVADPAISVNERLLALLSEIDGVSAFGCAQEPRKVLDLVRAVRPHVTILDLHTLGPSAIATVSALKDRPDPPITIVLSDYDEPGISRVALGAGADYFFAKAAGCGDLLRLLRDLQAGAAA